MTTINHEPDSYGLPLAQSTSYKPDKFCSRLLRSTYQGSHPWCVALIITSIRTCSNLFEQCIQIIFYSKYPLVLFMLFWISLVRCSSRSTIFFLIASREIQKYDQKKFYFFQKSNLFKFGIHVHH